MVGNYRSVADACPGLLGRDTSAGNCHGADGQHFIRTQGLDGILRNCHDADRFTQRVEQFQHAAARSGRGMLHEVNEWRHIAGPKCIQGRTPGGRLGHCRT